ncbi:FAD:protein FMN transferase [Nocardioides mangrovicus]|uniref:FAD:protein FMN transferase n=1 Tax=Nocardioides mangrovicus TaxID=2478913 RepID=A0A3L8P6R7_9ACTN|nr:FAD:protein FMN transferase [Nocardioides mangrovicus]RLV50667.1 FAD:protein FMN transferase [Nocardioides mangrovicus]
MLPTYDFDLWSCECRLVTTDVDALAPAVQLARELLHEVETACSRFRPDSELMRLRAGWNDVSPMLAELLREALVAAWLSDGAVDPTLGRAITGLGYDADIAAVRSRTLSLVEADPRDVVGPAAGWRSLRLDGHRVFRPDDVQLDLGATAKAAAADRVAATVAEQLGCGVLVSLGGDVATAGPGPRGGWQITVQDLPTDSVHQVSLAEGAAIATSSTMRRTWTAGERRLHHLLDPATGMPTRGPWRTVTVVAEDCARANTATTAAIVKGDDAVEWLEGLGLPTRLVDEAGAVRTLNGFPREVAA